MPRREYALRGCLRSHGTRKRYRRSSANTLTSLPLFAPGRVCPLGEKMSARNVTCLRCLCGGLC